MDEYIEKEPLLRKAKELQGGSFSSPLIVAAIETAPTIEIVRCRDCKHWKDTSFDTVTEDHWGECRKPLGDYRYCETAENDFCSYGERRENERN